MKDLLIPLGLLVAAVGVLYFVWAAPAARVITPEAPGAFVSAATTPPAAPPKPVAKAANAVRAGSGTTPARAPEVIAPDLAQPAAVATAPQAPPSQLQLEAPSQAKRQPPNPAEIAIGMPSRRVIELLGNPSLKATRVIEGRLVETYVYTETLEGDFVSIQLSGGRVVSEAR